MAKRKFNFNFDAYAKLTDVDKAYMAGFFDGEGNITIEMTQSGTVRVKVSVAQNRPAVLEKFYHVFGGSVFKGTGVYHWSTSAVEIAQLFLQTIRPHVIVKKLELDEALFVLDHRDGMTVEDVEKHKHNMRMHRVAHLKVAT